MNVNPIFTVMSMTFAVLLILSNIIAQKLIQIGPFTLPASIMIYPALYILSSVVAEVYGKKEALLLATIGCGLNILMALVFLAAISLPSAAFWQNQSTFTEILGVTPRIVIASIIGFWTGTTVNVLLTTFLKNLDVLNEKYRAIISNVSGMAVDGFLFVLIAFYRLPFDQIIQVFVAYYCAKVLYQLVLVWFMPGLVRWLKHKA